MAFSVRLGHEPLWLDETYSYAMVQHGFLDVIRHASSDVHPPLYYLLLKLTTSLLGSSPAALRVPSVLAATGLLALGAGPVRRVWGERAGYLFALLVATSPGMLCFAQEARMYALVAFLVTGAVVYGYLAARESRMSDLVKLGIFTWAAAMTQYFGLIAVAVNGLALMMGARSRSHRTRLLIALVVAAVAYTPWIIPLASQLTSVIRSFWIPPTSPSLVILGLVAPFTYKFEDVPYPWQAPVACLLVALCVLTTLVVRRWRNSDMPVPPQLLLLVVHASTLGFGLAFSWLMRPVFMPRYMMSCAGLVLLAAAVSFARLPRASQSLGAAAVLIGLGLPAWVRVQVESFNGPFQPLAARVRAEGEPPPVLLHNDLQALYPSWHAVPEAQHVLVTEKRGSFDVTGGGFYDPRRLTATDDIGAILSSAQRVWVVDAMPAQHHIAPASVLEHAGWFQKGPPLVLDLPMSWLKATVIRYERRATPRAALMYTRGASPGSAGRRTCPSWSSLSHCT